ncbi:peptidase inhibitor family I36 protein [Streptosporangium sp. G11]|uniref:peptidase inhibitor family I36 protein n=1 Tax=Streptosporangium sp. G11 TaxID=3436926 RepID=UPI003EBA1151
MRKFVVTLLVAFVTLAGAIAPATAATEPPARFLQPVFAGEVGPLAFDDCPAGRACLWTGDNATGTRWDAPSCGRFRLSSVNNNNFESVRNRGGGSVILYNGERYTERIREIYNNSLPIELTEAQDNRTSSLEVLC